MSNATPEHDDGHDARCEIELELGDGYENPCHCAARRAFPKSAGIDPRLLKIRVKRVRQAEAALTTVKRTLVTYITEHATPVCEAENTFSKCDAPTDGVLLVSCGHFAFLCAEHASGALRPVFSASHETTCTQKAPSLHEHPAVGVTLEWCGL